jgi:protease-4
MLNAESKIQRGNRKAGVPLERVCLAMLLLGATVALTRPATAQPVAPTRPLGGEPPTTGVRLHAPALVGQASATALEINPGALSQLQAWSAVYHHSEIPAGGRLQGRGDGLFLAAPLPFYRALVVGAGFQWLRPSEPIGYADTVKLGFSLAWSPISWLGVGVAFHTFISDDAPDIDQIEALDAGLVLRPNEWVGLGFAVRNLNTPVFAGLPLQRLYGLELVCRPLATNRLELGAGLQIGERRTDVDPQFRILAEPIAGIGLVGHLELVRRDFYRDGNERMDVRATLGLRLSLEQLSLTTSTIVGRHFEAGPGALERGSAARSVYQGVNLSLAASGSRGRSLWPRKRILRLRLEGRLDQRKWAAVVDLLQHAERREDVTGLLILVDQLALGWGMAQELRGWVARFQQRGKKVYAYLEAPSAPEYYAVSGATQVLLSPGGGLRLQGLATHQLYLRGLFDKLGIEPQFIRLAEYKSAPEMYTRKGPSEPAKKMMNELVDSAYQQLIHDLAESRGQTPEVLRASIDAGPYTPDRAKSSNLVDDLVSAETLSAKVTNELAAELTDPAQLRRATGRWPRGPAIAVVLIEGDIVDGKSRYVPLIERRMAGDRTVVEALARVRNDSRIRAVVLRINSPGGSALASERIWEAVRRTAERKPVIASMANVAASGGYYAAAGAHRILANRATITGSIGIFTGKFGLQRLLRRIGIAVDTTERGKRASLDSPFRPYTDEERTFILSRLQYYYRAFLRAVAESRKMTADAVHEVARGRVWTGKQAHERRLIDRHGGLAEAIDEAKRSAGLAPERPVQVLVLPRRNQGLLARLIGLTSSAHAEGNLADAVPPVLRAKLKQISPVIWYAAPTDPLARLPFDLVW